MGKFIGCVTLFLFGIGAVGAEEFLVSIKSVDGSKITYTKVLKGKKNKNAPPAEAMTATATSDVKVIKGTYDKATKTYTAGDAIEGGLTAKVFSNPATAMITINDSGMVTQVMVVPAKRKKKAAPTGDE